MREGEWGRQKRAGKGKGRAERGTEREWSKKQNSAIPQQGMSEESGKEMEASMKKAKCTLFAGQFLILLKLKANLLN